MARFEIEEHFLTGDIYEVSKDDWSKRRRFTDRSEAEAYYEYLKREEVQDSIAKNQAAAVVQNKAIIANQQRLIEAQERNSPMHNRPLYQQSHRQILDPEYQEWLLFKKETDPAYQTWKRRKEEEEAKVKAKKEAELLKHRMEEEAKRKRIEMREEQRKREYHEKLMEEIAPIETKIINGEGIPAKERNRVACVTENQVVIDIFKESDNVSLLQYLKDNKALSPDDLAYVKKRRNAIIKKSFEKSKANKKENERRMREAQLKKDNRGCSFVFLLILIFVVMIAFVVI